MKCAILIAFVGYLTVDIGRYLSLDLQYQFPLIQYHR